MNRGFTEFVFVIDSSVAMHGLEDTMITEFNSMLRELQAVEGEILITTAFFNDRYELFHDRTDIRAAAPLARADYTPGRNAAFLDAIGKSMHKFRRVRHGTKEEFRAEKVVFVIIAGKHDNAGRGYTEEMIRERIAHRRKKYGWEFVFFGGNMNAVAEAEKIRIAAELAFDFRMDADGLHTVYTMASAMLADFLKDGTLSGEKGTAVGKADDDIAMRAAENVISKYKADMNNIVFSFSGICRAIDEQNEGSAKKTLRLHLGSDIVFTGNWAETADERKLEEEELFEAEISASVFTIGCYTVRVADCLYEDEPDGIAPRYQERVPAGQDIIAEYRNREKRRSVHYEYPWELIHEKRARRVKEVYVKRHAGSEASADCWQNICMAAESWSGSWSESIDYICTVKKDDTIPDEQAVLFVLQRFVGSSYSYDSWYKFTPDGRLEKYSTGGYDPQGETTAWDW